MPVRDHIKSGWYTQDYESLFGFPVYGSLRGIMMYCVMVWYKELLNFCWFLSYLWEDFFLWENSMPHSSASQQVGVLLNCLESPLPKLSWLSAQLLKFVLITFVTTMVDVQVFGISRELGMLQAGLVGVAALVTWYIVSALLTWWRLRHIPGPFLAKFSYLWLGRTTHSGKQYYVHRELPKKYGPLVRIGPKYIITDEPDIIKNISSARSAYHRDGWYTTGRFNPYRDNLFTKLECTQRPSCVCLDPTTVVRQITLSLMWMSKFRTSLACSAASMLYRPKIRPALFLTWGLRPTTSPSMSSQRSPSATSLVISGRRRISTISCSTYGTSGLACPLRLTCLGSDASCSPSPFFSSSDQRQPIRMVLAL